MVGLCEGGPAMALMTRRASRVPALLGFVVGIGIGSGRR